MKGATGRAAARLLLCAALVAEGTAGYALAARAVEPGTDAPVSIAPLGVANPQRAWSAWTLNCQGCHRPDGGGSDATAPPLAGTVAKFLKARGGREYLGRVPGVASSALSNEALAELLNWMLWRFDPKDIPADFHPYTAEEVGQLRGRPLHGETSRLRRQLLKQAGASPSP